MAKTVRQKGEGNTMGRYALLVKGDRETATKEATFYGLQVYWPSVKTYARHNGALETVLIVTLPADSDDVLAIHRWFNRDRRPPYPDGTLLYFWEQE
jgi:hypothetical protein